MILTILNCAILILGLSYIGTLIASEGLGIFYFLRKRKDKVLKKELLESSRGRIKGVLIMLILTTLKILIEYEKFHMCLEETVILIICCIVLSIIELYVWIVRKEKYK